MPSARSISAQRIVREHSPSPERVQWIRPLTTIAVFVPVVFMQDEVGQLFGESFDIERKALWEGAEGPRGVTVTEKVYTLTRR